jgi:hypothetical protein
MRFFSNDQYLSIVTENMTPQEQINVHFQVAGVASVYLSKNLFHEIVDRAVARELVHRARKDA